MASRDFRLGAVKEPAGVHDYRIGALIIGADGVTFGAQAGEDAFTVNQRLGATEGDHADGRLVGSIRAGTPGIGNAGAGVMRNACTGQVGAEVGRVL